MYGPAAISARNVIRRVEVAVIGVGAIGAHTLWRLASRGVDTVGFERYSPGHSMGSSHGDTRIFRTAYFEGPSYVSLLKAALLLWRDLERESRQELLNLTGGLMIGSQESRTVQGALLSARVHQLEYELLDAQRVAQRYPQHLLDTGDLAIYEPLAGYLRPEHAVQAAANRAVELGAKLQESTEVLELKHDTGGVHVVTSQGEWQADRIVLTAGAWIPKLVPSSQLPLTIERVAMVWHAVQDPDEYAPDRFPIWLHELADGSICYGFPSTDGRTVKLATHHGGKAADPESFDRTVHPEDIAHVEAFVRDRMRRLAPEPTHSQICMYTNTPDRHFAIGELPGHPEVVLVSACSGHGFKFASVLGEVAAQLAIDRSSTFDLSFFDPSRLVSPTPTA